jgi:UDP:flavonoid glycosyltransferase YjiC (YdhE family)
LRLHAAAWAPNWLLPKVDVFVTNGGYGRVSQAISFGIPLVPGGTTEDKADVNARAAWSGVGVNLATNEPTQTALRQGARTVLDTAHCRARAAAMADEFRRIDTRSEIARVIDQVVYGSETERGLVQANQFVHTPRAA